MTGLRGRRNRMNKPKVLVACEYSGVVRDAFIAAGCDAVSCDLLPTESEGPHVQGDVLELLDGDWDLMVAHPPCTHLASSGARWFKHKAKVRMEALRFIHRLLYNAIPRVCLENPRGSIGKEFYRADQEVQPWWFGDPHKKTTCLWLKNLPRLVPTGAVRPGEDMALKGGKRMPRWYANAPKQDRSKHRSRTFQGLANAMASQWMPVLMGAERCLGSVRR